MIEADKSYDFDFDHQFIPCEKYDSKKGYKMKRGYFPEVAALGRYIVLCTDNIKFTRCFTAFPLFWILTNGW